MTLALDVTSHSHRGHPSLPMRKPCSQYIMHVTSPQPPDLSRRLFVGEMAGGGGNDGDAEGKGSCEGAGNGGVHGGEAGGGEATPAADRRRGNKELTGLVASGDVDRHASSRLSAPSSECTQPDASVGHVAGIVLCR